MEYGRQRLIRTADVKNGIFKQVAEDLKLSTRRLGSQIEVSKDVASKVIKE